METARAILHILRPYSSLLAFLAIVVPVFTRSSHLIPSLQKALPLLLVSFCTFIVNDLDDIEKDGINHPDRPFPSGQLKPMVGALLYYICLAAALLTIRFWIDADQIAFWYYVLLIVVISYHYVVEFLPAIKPAYVAAASTLPVVILIAYYPTETSLYRVGLAVFFFVLGRELCKDLPDRPGDPDSPLHRISPVKVAISAFVFQLIGLLLLSLLIRNVADLLVVSLMFFLLVLSFVHWFRLGRTTSATALMKAVIFCGLYFLI